MTAADPTLGGLLGPLPSMPANPAPPPRPARPRHVTVPAWVVDRAVELLEHVHRGNRSRDDDAAMLARALRQARER